MPLIFELKLSIKSIHLLLAVSRLKTHTSSEWSDVIPYLSHHIVHSRQLQSEGLIKVIPFKSEERLPGQTSNKWEVTEKGLLLIQYLKLEFKDDMKALGLLETDVLELVNKKDDSNTNIPKIRSRRMLHSKK